MSDEYPLFPELPEPGEAEAIELIEKFKKELVRAAEHAIGDLYSEVVPHIESDAWTNYRNHLMDGLQNYDNRMVQGEHDFKKIRQQIYAEYRDEIIADLNQDLVEENKKLKDHIDTLVEQRRSLF